MPSGDASSPADIKDLLGSESGHSIPMLGQATTGPVDGACPGGVLRD